MATQFRFNDEVRPFVMQLGELLSYANSRECLDYECQNRPEVEHGVYGHAFRTVKAILMAELGHDVGREAANLINFGGNESWGRDIEVAADKAIKDDEEEQQLEESLNLP